MEMDGNGHDEHAADTDAVSGIVFLPVFTEGVSNAIKLPSCMRSESDGTLL